MRVEFSNAFLNLALENDRLLLITGDLGFMALENIQSNIKDRFINAGISEQNMISVAASLAYDGFMPFTYSIAPFLVCRPYEQIRNEMGLHNLPVKLVANGGGYGYGIMGSTHHAPDDIALMRSVQNMKIYIPTFLDDVQEALPLMIAKSAPSYLRLNSSKKRDKHIDKFNAYRRLNSGEKAVVIGVGPVLLNFIELNNLENLNLEIWCCDQLPLQDLPWELISAIQTSQHLILAEEHYQAGGFGEAFISFFNRNYLNQISSYPKISYFNIEGYLSGNYGSQTWHLEENALAGKPLLDKLIFTLNY